METTLDQVMKEENVEMLTGVNGTPVVSFREQRDLNNSILGRELKVKERKYAEDGTVKASRYTTAAINLGAYYDNRYKVVKKKLYVVTAQTTEGYRALQNLDKGQVPFKQIAALTFERNEEGKLEYKGTVMISDADFITDFTKKMGVGPMKEILEVMRNEIGVSDTPEEENMPI